MYDSLDQAFTERTRDTSSIFSSYRILYDIYLGALKSLAVNKNTIKAIENTKKSVESQQKKISGQLYSQGFILLTGAAEVLLKDVFECLVRENFTSISVPRSVNFSAKDIQNILNEDAASADRLSHSLGNATVKILMSDKNPTKKINFQNVNSAKAILDQYFGLKLIDSDYLEQIHRHWQVRHTLIHSDGIIDDRFVHNVGVVSLLKPTEKVGARVAVSRQIYEDANEDFLKLFNELDQLIENTKLMCSLIGHARGVKDE